MSTSDFLIQQVITKVHSFLYVHIGFWTFRIDLRPNWNNYCNISNVPITLHVSQMKRISGSHYFIYLFKHWTLQHRPMATLSLSECKSVTSPRRCKENLWFDHKKFDIWLVNTGHVKSKATGISDLFEKVQTFAGRTIPKLSNTWVVIFSFSCGSSCMVTESWNMIFFSISFFVYFILFLFCFFYYLIFHFFVFHFFFLVFLFLYFHFLIFSESFFFFVHFFYFISFRFLKQNQIKTTWTRADIELKTGIRICNQQQYVTLNDAKNWYISFAPLERPWNKYYFW